MRSFEWHLKYWEETPIQGSKFLLTALKKELKFFMA
jgi:hypothetical protein